ncbi:GTPase [Noviherbaspirillum aerium]|uniref:GTPase n=1 Tax=Noviherbaspirillum aerium TaxID=2588497 RepID=UPI00124DB5B4|nr:GTPase [Noviherbaspirillum aerium]
MIATTLVTGSTPARREAAIAQALDNSSDVAVILEGLPDGLQPLEDLRHLSGLQVARIAPGCLCCTGNLTMRVTLNRMLRRHPGRLYIGLSTADHLARIREFLEQPPYSSLMVLTHDMTA